MTHFQAVILGIIQGATEFFPISSSGHLVLCQQFLGLNGELLAFDVAVHFGSLIAVLLVFRASILRLIAGCGAGIRSVLIDGTSVREVYRGSRDIRLTLALALGTVPAVAAGLTMKDFFEGLFHSAGYVFAAFAVTGCILLLTFLVKRHQRDINPLGGFIVGIAQAFAIIPGISRSGATISTALFLGVKREEAGEFSFLLVIPVISGAGIMILRDFFTGGITKLSYEIIVLGALAAFISGWISLVFLLRVIRKGKLGYFGFYCLAAAILGIILFVTNALPGKPTTMNHTENKVHSNIPSEQVTSLPASYDGAEQMITYYRAKGASRPLLVALHTWGYGYDQETMCREYFRCCETRDWHCVFPDFRGPNTRPEACGSEAAISDILDAVKWAQDTFDVDPRRIFLVGCSGGGHMALMVASHSPATWTAVSVWVPISNLTRWHRETTIRELHYCAQLEAICGGSPGTSHAVDADYKKRSPLPVLWRAHIIPMDINAGIHDGHGGTLGGEGSVPVGQSIRAFNALARTVEDYDSVIEEHVIDYIEEHEAAPEWFEKGETNDPDYPGGIVLRRTSSLARLTIFEGGHEILFDTAFAWFDRF